MTEKNQDMGSRSETLDQYHQRMNTQLREPVTLLLAQEDWHMKGTVGLYQDYENPHLWNVYDNEPNSRPTKWTYNTHTEKLQKRV